MVLNKKYLSLLFIVGISYISLLPLFHAGLPITHDGKDHVARIANFYQNLVEGNAIPRWAGNLNWGYGHPILMFLYPLPSYIASLYHALHFSLVDSVKIVFGLSFIASGAAMFLWLNEFLGEEAGFFGAILYLFAPYRFVDLYVRGAIGEHVAFIFPPLVCFFLLKSYLRPSYWNIVGGSFSLAGLLLSHNAMTLMFLPIIILYAVYLLFQTKNKKLVAISYVCIAFFGFGLSSFFVLPAFFEGKYTLRDIVTKGEEFANSFVSFKDFFYGPWSYGGTGQFTVQIGIIQWTMVLGFIICMFVKKLRKYERLFFMGVITVFIFTIFMMTSFSHPIWEMVAILKKFQFPWRFLSITVFLSAVMGAYVIASVPKKFKGVFLIVFIAITLFLNKDYWHANGYLIEPEAFFTQIYNGTTDTGESAPIWSIRFMERQAIAPIEVISGSARLTQTERKFTKHTYKIEAYKETRIRENTLFFPGWAVLVDGRRVSIEFQDQLNRGLMTFYVPKGKHVVQVLFSETKLRFLADAISIISLVILIFYGILNNVWRRYQLF